MSDSAPHLTPPPAPRRSTGSLVLGVVIGASLVLAAVGSWSWMTALRVSEETVQQTVWTTLLRETPQQFLVVGALDGVSSITMQNDRAFVAGLPQGLDFARRRQTVRVRAPGRATYGFDLRALDPSDIQYTDDRTVIVTLPPMTVFSVEPILEEADVSIQSNRWSRLRGASDSPAVQAALSELRPAFRRKAEAHLAQSDQPGRNAARAVEQMIRTPLEAAGVEDARFRFVVAPGDTLEGGGGDR